MHSLLQIMYMLSQKAPLPCVVALIKSVFPPLLLCALASQWVPVLPNWQRDIRILKGRKSGPFLLPEAGLMS